MRRGEGRGGEQAAHEVCEVVGALADREAVRCRESLHEKDVRVEERRVGLDEHVDERGQEVVGVDGDARGRRRRGAGSGLGLIGGLGGGGRAFAELERLKRVLARVEQAGELVGRRATRVHLDHTFRRSHTQSIQYSCWASEH